MYYKYLAFKRKKHASKPNIHDIERILIFRYDAIGDYFVSTPIIKHLKRMNPDLKIDVITSMRNDFIIKEDIYVNETYAINIKNLNSKISRNSIKKMKKNKYDLIIALVFTNTTKAGKLALKISPDAYKITSASKERMPLYSMVFDHITARNSWKEHISEQLLKSVHFLSNEPHCQFDINYYVPIPNEYFEQAVSFAEKNNLEYKPDVENIFPHKSNISLNGSPYFIINTTGSSELKTLETENAKQLINIILDKYPNHICFVTGDPRQKEQVENIVQSIGNRNCKILIENFFIVSSILAGAKLLISADTSLTHVAAAVKTPIIAFYLELYNVFAWYPMGSPFTAIAVEKGSSINTIDTDLIAGLADKYLQLPQLI